MSYEYLAKIDGSNELLLTRVLQAEDIGNRIAILDSDADQVTLRWIEGPKRPEWPEDITVSWVADGILVSFHSASAAQRDEFLALLAKLISLELKVAVRFEEN